MKGWPALVALVPPVFLLLVLPVSLPGGPAWLALGRPAREAREAG